MSDITRGNMTSNLHCASCGRADNAGPNGVKTITYKEVKWCTSCAAIEQTVEGATYVSMPSPGRMYEGAVDDPLNAWEDCYEKKPKKRILVKKAKAEIQRAWELWEGDKASDLLMFTFFGWLSRHRPYFLTFRSNGDPWQTVHSWLIQYEGQKKRESKNKDLKDLREAKECSKHEDGIPLSKVINDLDLK